MEGVDPNTGKTISGVGQAKARLFRAITTELGTRNKRRNVGGNVRKLFSIANETNRMKLINRIHRIIDNPDNDLSDIKNAEVTVTIHGAGFRVRIDFEYQGQQGNLEL